MKWDVTQYDANSRAREAAAIKLMEQADVARHERVLDVGCGTGTALAAFAKRARSVAGVDPSIEMITRAEEKTSGFPSVKLYRMRAEQMPFEAEFDLVYSSNALQWVKDQPVAISRMHAALVPGGRLAVQMPARGFSRTLVKCMEDALSQAEVSGFPDGVESAWYLPFAEEYDALLARAGFTDRKVWYEDIAMTFATVDEAMRWAESAAFVPFISRMDDVQRMMFHHAMHRSLTRLLTRSGLIIDYRRVVAMARK